MSETTLAPSAALTGALSGQTVSLVSQLASSSKCLDVYGDMNTKGTRLSIADCNGKPDQLFKWTSSGELKLPNGMCVDAKGNKGRNDDPLIVWPCNGQANQKWAPQSNGTITGINGKCVDVWGGGTAPGTQVTLYTCHGKVNQRWDTRGASTADPTPTDPTPTDPTPTPPPTSSSSVGPSSTLNPTSGVVIKPGESIQSKVNAYPAGTTFWLKAGTYYRQSVAPKDGQKFIGEKGAILDGQYAVAKAFFSTADNVTIRNLVIQNYNPPLQDGAIRGDWNASTGWVIEYNEVKNNRGGAGIYVSNQSTIRNNYVHHNGQIGILGRGNGAVVTGNEIAFNNTGGNDPNWAAGGTKFFYSERMRFDNNYVHDNMGPGIWFDINNIDCIIDGNRVENNTHAGIFYEISFGAKIRNNRVVANGGTGSIARSGILVSASPNVEVYGNTLSGNSNGIVGLQANRTDAPTNVGKPLVSGLWVHDNNVSQSRGVTGLVDQVGDGGIFSRNNKFDRNTYYVSSLSRPFYARGGSKTVSEWKSAGYDVSGIFR
jgi:parallel beta-helix repeat protein